MENFNQPAHAKEVQVKEQNGFKNLLIAFATAASLGITVVPNSAQADVIIKPNAQTDKFHLNGTKQELEEFLLNRGDQYTPASGFYDSDGKTQIDVIEKPKPGPGGNTTNNSIVTPVQNTNNNDSNANATNHNTNTSTQDQNTSVDQKQRQGQGQGQSLDNQNTVNPQITNTVSTPPITNTINPVGTTVVTPPPITNTATSNPKIRINNVVEQPNQLYNLLGTSNQGIGNFNQLNNFSNQDRRGDCDGNSFGNVSQTENIRGRIGGPEFGIGADAKYNQFGDGQISAGVQVLYKFGNEGVKVSRTFVSNVTCLPAPSIVRENTIIYKDTQERHEIKKDEECECEGDGTKENKVDKPKTLAPLRSRLEKLNPKTLIFDQEHHVTPANLIKESYESQ